VLEQHSVVTRLEAGQSGVSKPAEARDLSLLQNIQTGCGAHPPSYSMGAGGSFFQDTVARTWHCPLTSIQYQG
jgi:hypothetical protein